MSAARDLAIARAVLDWCKLVQDEHGLIGKLTDDNLREWIAAVDASLGVPGVAASEVATPAPVAAEPPSKLPPVDGAAEHDHYIYGTPKKHAAEPPSDLYGGLCQRCYEIATGAAALCVEEAMRMGQREAKREAVGLLRNLLDYIVTEPDHSVPQDVLHALEYIAAFEADAAEEGKP
jgi:hypothetical protein